MRIGDRPGPATLGWVINGLTRTGLVAATTPAMFLAITWVESAVSPAVMPNGNYTLDTASAASAGDYATWAAAAVLYLGLFTWFAAMVGAGVGLALGLLAAGIDAVTLRRVPPAIIGVAITLVTWTTAIATSRRLGQGNWVVEDFGQLVLSAPFILGLVTLAVAPLTRDRTTAGSHSVSQRPATARGRRGGARV